MLSGPDSPKQVTGSEVTGSDHPSSVFMAHQLPVTYSEVRHTGDQWMALIQSASGVIISILLSMVMNSSN